MIGINLNVIGDRRGDVPILVLETDPTVYPMTFPDGESSPRGQFLLPDGIPPHGSHIYWGCTDANNRDTCQSVPSGCTWKHPDTGNPKPLAPGSYECGLMDEGVSHIDYKPAFTPLPSLSIAGRFFRAGGQRITLKGASAFALYARFLNGENVEPLFAELQSIGFNCQRLFMLNMTVYRILPWDYGQRYYDDFPTFLRMGARYSQYFLMCATTQAQTLMNDRGRCQDHINALADVAKDETNWIGAFGNELNNADNRLPDGLVKPPHGLWSRGDFAGDPGEVGVPEPDLDFVQVHPYSVSGGRRIDGQQAGETGEAHGKPCLVSEKARFMDMDNVPRHAHDSAKWVAARAAGSFFHSWRGKLSQPYQETEGCARMHCLGMDEVPLEYQDGEYFHPTHLETPGMERMYGKRLGGKPDLLVPIYE